MQLEDRKAKRRKPCKRCGGPKPPGMRRHFCDSCGPVRGTRAYKDRANLRKFDWRLKRYGISLEKYGEMFTAQKGVCAICSLICESGMKLAVDHDHETGRVRGLLCRRCNQILGRMNDDPDLLRKAAEYLECA